MFRAVGKADDFECGFNLFAPLRAREPREQQRQFDIFGGGENGNQIKGLKNEADVLVAPVGELRFVELGYVHALHETFAAGRSVHAGDDVEQGRFAGAGRPHERKKFARGDVQRDAVKRCHLNFALGVNLGQRTDFYNGFSHKTHNRSTEAGENNYISAVG